MEYGILEKSRFYLFYLSTYVMRSTKMINTQPEVCNLCGGKVIYTSNARVYHGREYGSGYCYLCLACGAYVGTHKPHPKEALGLLADERMRKGKIMCHALFDAMWKGKKHEKRERDALYRWLA